MDITVIVAVCRRQMVCTAAHVTRARVVRRNRCATVVIDGVRFVWTAGAAGSVIIVMVMMMMMNVIVLLDHNLLAHGCS